MDKKSSDTLAYNIKREITSLSALKAQAQKLYNDAVAREANAAVRHSLSEAVVHIQTKLDYIEMLCTGVDLYS